MDVTGVLLGVDRRQALVRLCQGLHFRRWDQAPAAEPAALALDPALLVGTGLTRGAVERRETDLP